MDAFAEDEVDALDAAGVHVVLDFDGIVRLGRDAPFAAQKPESGEVGSINRRKSSRLKIKC